MWGKFGVFREKLQKQTFLGNNYFDFGRTSIYLVVNKCRYIDNNEFSVFDGANYCGGVVVHDR